LWPTELPVWSLCVDDGLSTKAHPGAETDEASAWFARVWQAEDGLPENNVTGVLQTKEGYLWVSTHIGLSRFDGVAFRLIPSPFQRQGQSNDTGDYLLWRDHLWLAMEGGFLAEVSSGISRVFTSSNGLPSIRPLSVACDREGNPGLVMRMVPFAPCETVWFPDTRLVTGLQELPLCCRRR